MNRKEIKFILTYLDSNRENLDTFQYEFLATLKKQYNATGVLTIKQAEFLDVFKVYIPSLAPVKVVYNSEPEKFEAELS